MCTQLPNMMIFEKRSGQNGSSGCFGGIKVLPVGGCSSGFRDSFESLWEPKKISEWGPFPKSEGPMEPPFGRRTDESNLLARGKRSTSAILPQTVVRPENYINCRVSGIAMHVTSRSKSVLSASFDRRRLRLGSWNEPVSQGGSLLPTSVLRRV